jgi:MFS family permease
MKDLFSNKVFKIIMTTDIIQQMCIWIRNISILFFVVEKTDADPIAISLITVFEYLPMFVFSYIGGTLADKWNPKKTMIFGDFFSAISIIIILLLISSGLWEAVFAATLVSSIVTQFSIPSSNIMFKRHIDEKSVTQAISLSQSSQSLFLIVGPIIGTFLYGSIGINLSLLTIAILFFISSAVQFLLPSDKKSKEITKSSILSEMKEGLSYIMKNPGMKVICTLLAVLGISQGLIQPLAIYLITDRLSLQKESLQLFYSLYGVGLFVGAIVCSIFAGKFKTRWILFFGMNMFALITIIEVLSKNVFLTSVMYFMAGGVLAFLQVALSSPLIKTVSEEYIGRINGLITPLLIGGNLLGSALSGVLMNQITLIPVFLISAGLLIICGFIGLRYREFELDKSTLSTQATTELQLAKP